MQKKQMIIWLIIISILTLLTACGGTENSNGSSQLSADSILQHVESVSSTSNTIDNLSVQGETGKSNLAYEIVGPSQYTSVNEDTIFIGAIRNIGEDILPTFRLTMEMYDKNGNVVASQITSGSTEAIWPGELAPFWFSFTDISDWNSHAITVDTSDMFINMMHEFDNNLTISNVEGKVVTPPTPDDSGWYQISGTVINNGNKTADYVTVFYLIYDGNNIKAVGASSPTNASQSGTEATFDHRFSLFDDSGDLNIYVGAVSRTSQ